MSDELQEMMARVREIQMTEADWEAQRISFAYGNVGLENPSITRESVRRVSEQLREEKAHGHPRKPERG